MPDYISPSTLLEAPCLAECDGPGFVIPITPAAPTLSRQCEPPVVTIAPQAWAEGVTSLKIRRRIFVEDQAADAGWSDVETLVEEADHDDETVLGGLVYEFSVAACNDAGCSDWSTPASIALISTTLSITILEPAASDTLTGVQKVRFQLADAGDPGVCEVDLTLSLGDLPVGGAPYIETPDACTDDDIEARNAIYIWEADTRLYPQGAQELKITGRGTDCCLKKAAIAVTLDNDLLSGVYFKDFLYDRPASPGRKHEGAIISLQDLALSPSPSLRWRQQWRIATDTSPSWPLSGEIDTEKLAEWDKMQTVAPENAQSYGELGTRPQTTQRRGAVKALDYPGQKIVWRQRWEPVEAMKYFATLTGVAASVVKIRTMKSDQFLILARADDSSVAGLYSFDGVNVATIAEPGENILDAAALGDKVYAIFADGRIRVYDMDSGQIALDWKLPAETRLPKFIEIVGGKPIVLCVNAALPENQTQAYDLSFAAPQALWQLDGAATVTFPNGSGLAVAVGADLFNATATGSTPIAAQTFADDITAMFGENSINAIGLESGDIQVFDEVAGWQSAATRPDPITAIGAFQGDAASPRVIAGTADDQLTEQLQSGAWAVGALLLPPAALSGATITKVPAMARWVRSAADEKTGTPARDALLIGTGPSALLGMLERSPLTDADGSFVTSEQSDQKIDPLPSALA